MTDVFIDCNNSMEKKRGKHFRLCDKGWIFAACWAKDSEITWYICFCIWEHCCLTMFSKRRLQEILLEILECRCLKICATLSPSVMINKIQYRSLLYRTYNKHANISADADTWGPIVYAWVWYVFAFGEIEATRLPKERFLCNKPQCLRNHEVKRNT